MQASPSTPFTIADAVAASPPSDQIEYCYRHGAVETALHCTACDRPICVRCMTHASGGQICPECRKGRRAVNYKIAPIHLIKGGAIALAVSLPAAALASMLGAWLFLMFAAPTTAEIIVRAVDWATRCKRGRPMQITVGVMIGLSGALVWWFGLGLPLEAALFALIGSSMAVARLR